MTWTESLHANPIPWLLEEENPPVRYWTLLDLLDRPAADPEVQAARAAITAYPPVTGLLATQKRDGYWLNRDYYLPKHDGTFWVLSMLGDMGLTAEQEQIRRACEFMFTFQRDDGAFWRRRRVASEGLVWSNAGLCTHGRIVRFLIQFGYGVDARIRHGVDWLLAAQRDDGMWDCGRPDRPGCLRASLDALRVAVLDPAAAAEPAVQRGARTVYDLLMKGGMSKYHVGMPWTALEYPYFDYGLIPALDALLRLGYTAQQARIAQGIDYLLGRQLRAGSWPLDQKPYRLPFDVGQPGEPNKWLTLDALRLLKAAADGSTLS
jgi:Squalene-hopene cyclase C-terminal domain